MMKPGPEGKAMIPENLAKAIVAVHLDLISQRCCDGKNNGVSHRNISDAMDALSFA